MIPFNRPAFTGNEEQYVLDAMRGDHLSGDGKYAQMCQGWFQNTFQFPKVLLTTSCTHALESAALLIGIRPGDEVIMPSYTFVSTANAFALRGAKVVFVDVRPDTMNINEDLIEAAITPKTKAIVPVHYAGVGCDMDAIMDIAGRHCLFVVEDAAQGIMSSRNGEVLGCKGHFASYSFHETKNVTSGGEGGLLILNDERFFHLSDIVRDKGTNRKDYFSGLVDKYSWVGLGSSYLPSELQAAYLWGQLEFIDQITKNRLRTWSKYQVGLRDLEIQGKIELPRIPSNTMHNGHLFFIKCRTPEERDSLLANLRGNGVHAVFHYIPLHTSIAGRKLGRFDGIDQFTSRESGRLLRLPIWYGISDDAVQKVIDYVWSFYS